MSRDLGLVGMTKTVNSYLFTLSCLPIHGFQIHHQKCRFFLLILSAHSLSWSFQLITFPLQFGLSIASECVFYKVNDLIVRCLPCLLLSDDMN